MKNQPTTSQKSIYKKPVLLKIGSLKTLTLKTGSTSDGSLPRVV